jgi:hypothetical protein
MPEALQLPRSGEDGLDTVFSSWHRLISSLERKGNGHGQRDLRRVLLRGFYRHRSFSLLPVYAMSEGRQDGSIDPTSTELSLGYVPQGTCGS